jgi:hypothetical protein
VAASPAPALVTQPAPGPAPQLVVEQPAPLPATPTPATAAPTTAAPTSEAPLLVTPETDPRATPIFLPTNPVQRP